VQAGELLLLGTGGIGGFAGMWSVLGSGGVGGMIGEKDSVTPVLRVVRRRLMLASTGFFVVGVSVGWVGARSDVFFGCCGGQLRSGRSVGGLHVGCSGRVAGCAAGG